MIVYLFLLLMLFAAVVVDVFYKMLWNPQNNPSFPPHQTNQWQIICSALSQTSDSELLYTLMSALDQSYSVGTSQLKNFIKCVLNILFTHRCRHALHSVLHKISRDSKCYQNRMKTPKRKKSSLFLNCVFVFEICTVSVANRKSQLAIMI